MQARRQRGTKTHRARSRKSRTSCLRVAVASFLLLWFSTSSLAQEKITYTDHLLPVFRNTCLNCHNPDKKKGELDLSTYAGVLTGGGSGKAVEPGDPEGSLLYRLVTHAEEPSMPPKGKLGDKELETIKQWIVGGVLETSGSTAVVSDKPKLDLTVSVAAKGKPDGELPMPGDLLLEPPVHTPKPGAVLAMASSPWAPLVAVGGQKQVLLFNPQTRELLGVLPFPEGFPNVLRFSRSGKLLLVAGGVGAKSGKAVLFDIASGNRVTEVGDELDSVLAADISPDQSLIALGGPSKSVKIYSTATGAMTARINKHTDWITAIAFSPDGVLLATGDRNGSVIVWEAQTVNEFYTLPGHKAAVTSARFRADSNVLATSGEDNDVKLWDMHTGKQAKNIAAHPGGVLSVDFAPDGRLVTAGRDNRVKTWKPDGSAIKTYAPFDDIALHAVFDNSDGKLVIGADWTGAIRIFDVDEPKAVAALPANPVSIAERLSQSPARLAELQTEATKLSAELDAAIATATKTAAQKREVELKVTTVDQTVSAVVAKTVSLQEATKAAVILQTQASEKRAEADRLLQAASGAIASPETAATAFKAATAAAEESRQRADTARKAFEQITADVEGVRKSIAEVQIAKSEVQKQLAQVVEREKRHGADVDRLKPRSEKATADVADFKRQIARLQAGHFFTQVYGAREMLRQRQAEADTAAAAAKAAQAAAEKAVADVPAFEKRMTEFPQSIVVAERAIPLAEQAANAAVNVTKGVLAIAAERDAFVKQLNEQASQIAQLAARDPSNKLLADASTAAKSAADLLTADLAKFREGVKAQEARASAAAAALVAAHAALEKEKLDQQNAPQTLKSLRAAVPIAQATVTAKKAEHDAASVKLNDAKAVVDQLDAVYAGLKKQLGLARAD
jgi:WD40 repeat protein